MFTSLGMLPELLLFVTTSRKVKTVKWISWKSVRLSRHEKWVPRVLIYIHLKASLPLGTRLCHHQARQRYFLSHPETGYRTVPELACLGKGRPLASRRRQLLRDRYSAMYSLHAHAGSLHGQIARYRDLSGLQYTAQAPRTMMYLWRAGRIHKEWGPDSGRTSSRHNTRNKSRKISTDWEKNWGRCADNNKASGNVQTRCRLSWCAAGISRIPK